MDISLTDDEAGELKELLEQTLGDLSPEIADTDNVDYRRMLRNRRELLESVYKRLSG